MNRRSLFALAAAILVSLAATGFAFAQTSTAGVAEKEMSGMPGMDGNHPDPHMVMTTLGQPQPGDRERAEKIVETVRAAMAKYKDYHVALADGFRIFAPEFPGREKHFTNWRYAAEAQRRFDPAHPTSLLYDRTPDGGWKLVGAMFTAPRSYTLEQLNERVPLSVARWHRHVNFCFPPRATMQQIRQDRAQNGQISPQARQQFLQFFQITDQSACEQAGGRWVPQLFGWMVHVYPYSANPWHLAPGV